MFAFKKTIVKVDVIFSDKIEDKHGQSITASRDTFC